MTRISKNGLLAEERQEPMTAAEHAQAEGHQYEYARDVPRTCVCIYQWNVHGQRYALIAELGGCPWHTSQGGQ